MYTNTLMLDYYRTSDLPRIGASVDYYFHDDMGREDMPDYKFYVMMNLFDISDKEREIIIQKAKKNHAVVLWLYAPGFINPDRDQVWQMRISRSSQASRWAASTTPALRGLR